jgi:hypothetical protein
MATVRLQLRRGIADDWFDANPVLAAGEIGIETDTNTFKFGDGTTAWNSLAYALSGTVDDYILLGAKGVANGVATLDASGLIPLAQLPGANALDAEVATAVTAGINTHNAVTTSVHGIANTASLVTLDANQTLTAKTLMSPSLTGTPVAPTANAGTDTTQIATTAFVQDAIELVVGAAPSALNTLAEIATSLANNADLSGTLTTSISNKVAKAGDTMTGVLNMGTNKITSLGTATTDFEATNKLYVDERVLNAVSLHQGYSTNVHGISDTANLVYTGDYRLIDARNPIDLSVSSGKITDLAVTTAKIADASVVTAKLGDTSVTTIKIADDAITSDKIADNAISQIHLSDDSVGTNEIGGLAVTTAKIADNAVTTAKIADLNITEGKINASAVTADKIGALAVTEGKIAADAVTTAKIADSAITTGKIANGTIIDADVNASAAIAQSKIANLTTDLSAKLASATAATTYAPIASPTFTGTVAGITSTMVGLGNVDNTSDANKPVSTATTTALALKANLASPALTGTPTAPLAATGTNTTQIATTSFVQQELSVLTTGAPAALNTLDELAAALGDDANYAATITTALGTKAPIASPTFTGTVTIPAGASISGFAPLASPTFTGTVTVAAAGVAFTDKTQTKAGVPSLTTIASAVSSNTTLDALGTDAAVRDSLVPLSGAVGITFEATGNAKYAIGSSISFYQSAGTGANFIESGITVLATPGRTLRTTNSSVTATKVAATTWLLAGDLKA